MNTPSILLGDRTLGSGQPTYVVAEMSGNHNGSFDRAVALIRAAKEAGADAVKLQTYTADSMTIRSDSDLFRIRGGLWDGRTLYELYGEAFTPWDWQPRLLEVARDLGLELFSTPFDETAVAFLEELGVRAYKVSSFEIVDIPLIKLIARTNKPIFISTGMATLAEIQDAVDAARSGTDRIVLLRCVSEYPAAAADMDLATIPHLASAFGTPAGLSDHTLGVAVPVAAVALGACVIEKHLTLKRTDGGPDSAFSLEPHEFAEMVRSIRTVESAVGAVRYGPTAGERPSQVFRRSLFVVADMGQGEEFTSSNIRAIRPGYGLGPKWLYRVLGRHARQSIPRGTPLSWDLIA